MYGTQGMLDSWAFTVKSYLLMDLKLSVCEVGMQKEWPNICDCEHTFFATFD